MNKILVVLLLITMECNVIQAKLPITAERVKKKLLDIFEFGATIDPSDIRMQRYMKYVTAERQIKYLTVQVNDLYGYIQYLDRLFKSEPEKYSEATLYEIELRKALVKRCQSDYSCMDKEGLEVFCEYSQRITSLILAFDNRLRSR